MSEAASPIIGGATDIEDPAVVLLASYPSDKSMLDTCTAVLVAPDVLITAAHCVDAKKHPGHTFGIFPGPDATAFDNAKLIAPLLMKAREVRAHPDYNQVPPFHADIGVVVLEEPLAIKPLPLNREPLTKSIEGEAARIIGYGQTVYGNYNAVKHAATTVVASLDESDTVVVGDSEHRSCVGDSGGPALVEMNGVETIIGVDSYTDTTGCVEPAHFQRTDVYADFIDLYAPPPAPGMDGSGTTAGEGGSYVVAGGCALAPFAGARGLAAALLMIALAALGSARPLRRSAER
jgi:secreted trypsin-like serine protease